MPIRRMRCWLCRHEHDGHIVEEGSPKEFFEAAKSDRARDFVDKIIHH